MRGAACSDGRAASTSGKQPQKVSISFLSHLVIRWSLRDDDDDDKKKVINDDYHHDTDGHDNDFWSFD